MLLWKYFSVLSQTFISLKGHTDEPVGAGVSPASLPSSWIPTSHNGMYRAVVCNSAAQAVLRRCPFGFLRLTGRPLTQGPALWLLYTLYNRRVVLQAGPVGRDNKVAKGHRRLPGTTRSDSERYSFPARWAGCPLPCRMEGVPKKAVSERNTILMQYFKMNAKYPW